MPGGFFVRSKSSARDAPLFSITRLLPVVKKHTIGARVSVHKFATFQ
jgi:hypothetical protein